MEHGGKSDVESAQSWAVHTLATPPTPNALEAQ